MSKFEDLSPEDATYYIGDGSFVHPADFVSYLSSVQDPFSVPDGCLERCRKEMDGLRSSKEMCDGSLADAMACMRASGIECIKSDFVTQHAKDCQSNITEDGRGLEMQEAADEHELLTNEILTNESVSARNLVFPGIFRPRCLSKALWFPYRIPAKLPVWCRQQEVKAAGFSFKLKFTYGLLGGKMGLAILVFGCAPFTLIFGMPPYPIYCKKCVGGEIKVVFKKACPQMPLTITGRVFFEYRVGFDFLIWEVNFAKLGLSIEAGLKSTQASTGKCWWERNEGWPRRRSWARRRAIWTCQTREICDIYVKGTAYISALMDCIKLSVSLTYWVKSAKLVCRMQFDVWNIFISSWSELLGVDLFTFWL